MNRAIVKADITVGGIVCSQCGHFNSSLDVIDGKQVTRCRMPDCGHTNEKVTTYTARERTNFYTRTIRVLIGRKF
jgi:hypothetical protein